MIYNKLMFNKKESIGIISYCDKVRTFANVNHEYYSSHNGYTYIYDISPTKSGIFLNKVEKLLKYLDLFDWVMWIDDDAFFLQHDKRIEDFIAPNRKSDLIFCKSPINPEGGWTFFSSGNFIMKNTPAVKEWLKACLNTDLNEVKQSWDADKYGIFTNGDQDIMTHLLVNDVRFNKKGFYRLLDYTEFNTRPYHFDKSPDEHFLVHFTGTDKNGQAIAFADRFNLSHALIDHNAFNSYKGIYPISNN